MVGISCPIYPTSRMEWYIFYKEKKNMQKDREWGNLSVSLGTMSIISFGLKVRALLMNWFAREALTPKGGFNPMTCE